MKPASFKKIQIRMKSLELQTTSLELLVTYCWSLVAKSEGF